jgi:hypothetical protein
VGSWHPTPMVHCSWRDNWLWDLRPVCHSEVFFFEIWSHNAEIAHKVEYRVGGRGLQHRARHIREALDDHSEAVWRRAACRCSVLILTVLALALRKQKQQKKLDVRNNSHETLVFEPAGILVWMCFYSLADKWTWAIHHKPRFPHLWDEIVSALQGLSLCEITLQRPVYRELCKY